MSECNILLKCVLTSDLLRDICGQYSLLDRSISRYSVVQYMYNGSAICVKKSGDDKMLLVK